MLKGSCLCGAISYQVTGPLSDDLAGACHCTQCRKQSGHYWAAASVPDAQIAIAGPVKWYRSSPHARRGFCPECGSFLFWQRPGSGKTDFSLGSVDGPTGLNLSGHIYTAFKGDYYEIADGLPQDPRE